jgi:GTP-binding protein
MKQLFHHPCDYAYSVTALSQLPNHQAKEFVFIGRSNVGKSSLLNALVRRRKLMRTSHTPGRTQMLNFFSLSHCYLVDVPGMGYAKASKKAVASWQKLLYTYIETRPQIARIFLLIDSRHGLKPVDREMMTMMDECGISYQCVLTKTDKVKKTEEQRIKQETTEAQAQHPAMHPTLLWVSAHKRTGLDALRNEIFMLLEGRTT